MKGLFIDAVDALADVYQANRRAGDPPIDVNEQEDIAPEALPGLLAGYHFILNDHTTLPTAAMARCPDLRHVIFLGTGARSYMNPRRWKSSASRCTSSRATGTSR